MSGLTDAELPEEPMQGARDARPVVPHFAETTPHPAGFKEATDLAAAPRKKRAAVADPLEEANVAIATLTSAPQLSIVERSNLFDDWKEALSRAAQAGVERSIHQRQIVGALLSSARQRDSVHFNAEQLVVLRTATNAARCGPHAVDVSRVIRAMTAVQVLRPLGLSADGISEEEEGSLRAMLGIAARGVQE